MKAIAVIDKNRALGKEGQLLYHLPSDLKHFKSETIGRTIVMGRKTVDSMPGGKPLPGRTTLMISRSIPFPDIPDDAIICGGAQIYKMFIDQCDELVLTEVDAETEDADAYFPEFKDEFELYEEGEQQEENGIRFRINRYRRKAQPEEDFDAESAPQCE